MKKYTIRDVAKAAGVSHMTVSRVLNNNPRVRANTREKVQKAITEMGYEPNAMARAFVTKKSQLIGLVVSDISNPFYAEISRGIEDKAFDLGYSVIFCSSDENTHRTEACVKNLLRTGVDGMIFTSVHLKEPAAEKLIADGFPVVLVNRKLRNPNCHYVTCNNFQGSYDATEHLINLGYKKIGIISGYSHLSTGLDRLKGYKKALEDHGIPQRPEYIIETSFSADGGFEAAKELLVLKDRPEAIMGGNDYIALGVMDAAEALGLSIPEDFALTGFDNTDFAARSRTKLTTVSQKIYEMGSIAVQIIVDTIDRKNLDYAHKVVLNPNLIIRESCGYQLHKK
ncbi:MAG: LacI family DNA-binding transcriptional regulator [Desulfobacterales bacterium]|nr:LacI family DNA-binding transcriptional regulator [Desulfobacterales bacterium]